MDRSISTSVSSLDASTAANLSTEGHSLASEESRSVPKNQMDFGEMVGAGPIESRKASHLSTKSSKPKLVLGQSYKVEVVIKPMRGSRPPGCKPIQVMQLIDKRSNGVLIMQYDTWVWDRHLTDPDKKAVKKLKLVKIKASQIKGLAHEEAA